jgi:proteasome alpha subunit
MGGQADTISTALKNTYTEGMELDQALRVAVAALSSINTNGADTPTLDVDRLEVAVLDRGKRRRAFRRIAGAALADLLPSPAAEAEADGDAKPEEPAEGDDKSEES